METTSFVSLPALSPHPATIASHRGQVQSILRPPSSFLEVPVLCSLSPKPVVSMALNFK